MTGRGLFGGFADAVRFLTILPLPGRRHRWTPEWAPWATAAFPVVGLLIGGVLWALLSLPLPPLSRGVATVAAWTVVTGALHEDGWADALDAALAPADRARRLAILKDPRAGVYGVIGLVLLLLLRLAGVMGADAVAVVPALVAGRWAMVAATRVSTPARDEGLAAGFFSAARPVPATVVAAALLACVAWASPGLSWAGAGAAWAAAAVAGWLMVRFLAGRLGGLTGDGLGAAGAAAELAALWALHAPGG
ncbi:MAG: adenosylcobinamide-GDP ribazoletransferase [Gemmatimonadetes bacterium]|nr:adenosylcobinamide-GDP ribazoletransferase [Gemmatimonadota bacterium]NIR78403.1 adenosylcobinamide-GDP ribazoletransferase [Gemmatimonadota bacterium]NIT87015.1 adenosylcobinamide-GDP ribazoletransferase [Gemmatimonadota bacterium]NIU30853.1 adenosylcobinamide-GDP ribazoletransferase [Gemmatimonadota bacterium]NIU35622.1 adenosylcobinamide-GDP ribazoletransferase [Gemmatimonadota bacterium]